MAKGEARARLGGEGGKGGQGPGGKRRRRGRKSGLTQTETRQGRHEDQTAAARKSRRAVKESMHKNEQG